MFSHYSKWNSEAGNDCVSTEAPNCLHHTDVNTSWTRQPGSWDSLSRQQLHPIIVTLFDEFHLRDRQNVSRCHIQKASTYPVEVHLQSPNIFFLQRHPLQLLPQGSPRVTIFPISPGHVALDPAVWCAADSAAFPACCDLWLLTTQPRGSKVIKQGRDSVGAALIKNATNDDCWMVTTLRNGDDSFHPL